MDDPLPTLSAAEVRVLGALIEKQITTPDYYPLTLNALTNACNQLTNREPVVSFDEQTVVRAVDSLREKRLATLYAGAESRVAKYKHTLTDALLLTPGEVALLCVLMLRGPQTLGELRARTERLYKFDTLPEIESALDALAARQPQPLVARLPRQPGTKESRYAQLFAGPAERPATPDETAPAPAAPPLASAPDRITQLEQEVADLRRELADVRQELATFRRQFD
jgi:uncharacterized protein YceH (UPF0502 family)